MSMELEPETGQDGTMPLSADQALAVLYARKPEVMAIIVTIVRDLHLAEDVFQELAVLLMRKYAEIRNRRALPAWIRSAARLEALTTLRTQRRHQPFDDEVLDLLAAQWESASTSARVERSLVFLRTCLQHLSAQARDLLSARYVRRLPMAEVAARVGCSHNALYLSLSRIHRRLGDCVRKRLDREELGDD